MSSVASAGHGFAHWACSRPPLQVDRGPQRVHAPV
jgi:hypothetical protein